MNYTLVFVNKDFLVHNYRVSNIHCLNFGNEGSRVRQTSEEDQRTCQLKRNGNNNKDEDNSLKTLNDKIINIPIYYKLFSHISIVSSIPI